MTKHYPCGCSPGHTCTTHAIRARAVPSVVRPRVLPPVPATPAAAPAPSKPKVRGFSFTVPGQPVPKERAGRAVTVNKVTGKAHVRSFNPTKTADYEKKVARAAVAAGVRQMLRGRLGIQLAFYRADNQRCDLDNLEKSVKDALNKVAYADDSQICRCVKSKDVDPDNPRAEVRIWELPEEIFA